MQSAGGDMTDQMDLVRDAAPLAEKCLDMGCASVLIKCGLSGMYYQSAGRERLQKVGERLRLPVDRWADAQGTQPCFRAKEVRSAAGAGDVSIAAYLTAVMRGLPPDTCACLAAAEGAASVASYDALGGTLSLEELEIRIRKGWK